MASRHNSGAVSSESCKTAIREELSRKTTQHLYPLELSCDCAVQRPPVVLSSDALIFRPRRQASSQAEERICQIAEAEENVE